MPVVRQCLQTLIKIYHVVLRVMNISLNAYRRMEGQTDRQTDTQTDRQTHTVIIVHICGPCNITSKAVDPIQNFRSKAVPRILKVLTELFQ